MSQRKKLSVNSIEFESIKSNIKDFLRNQEEFRDYDFEGSALAVLIDTLAYNTYYQAFYNNVVANEMFIDSAVKRASVVSHAKTLGYTPNSKTAPTAVVNVTYGSTPSESVLLPGAQFNTNVNGQVYTFVNIETAQISSDTTPNISNLEIKEGVLTSASFIVPDRNSNRKYIIPDEDVDISTIKVNVQTSQNDTTGINDTWSRAQDLTTITSESKVYYIEENSEGKFQIFFGDDVLGQKLSNGNLITIRYLVTNGPAANDAGKNDSSTNRSFIFGSGANIVEVTTPAIGGSNKESIESIRFKAPRAYSSQNRAVTKADYSSLVESNFTGFDSVFVFGGEEAEPPSFGSVYIAIKPSLGTEVTEDVKRQVENFLLTKSVVSITPRVIEPDYTYLRLDVNVFYDGAKTSLTNDSLRSAIRSSVTNNLSLNLGKFNKNFSVSGLLTAIDSTSSSIESSKVTVQMEKKILPTDSAVSYEINYGNPIYHPHTGHESVITSNTFKYINDNNEIKNVFMEDDGNGNISFYERTGQTKILSLENAGTVTYDTGKIFLNQVLLSSPSEEPYIRIFAQSQNQRYISKNEKIVFCDFVNDPSSIKVTATKTQ